MSSTRRNQHTAPVDETASESSEIPTVKVGELDIARLDFDSSLSLLGQWLDGDRPRQIATANLDFLELTSRNQELREALACADLITADGEPLVWLSRMLGQPVPERVAGSDLVVPLVGEAAARGRSVYLLGAAPGVGKQAANVLVQRYPDLRVAGVASPMIRLDDDSCLPIVSEIRDSRADLLVVAFGSPKQDVFLKRYLHETGCRVGIGVGATLDFIAGRVRRAPRIFQRLALEWVFRLGLEPRRLAGRYARDAVYLMRLATHIAVARAASLSQPRRLPSGVRS